MAITAPGGMLGELMHAVAQLALSPPGLTAFAATVVTGAALAAVLVLIAGVARLSRATAALPLLRRAVALREKSWRAAYSRQRDPDAAGRARPRAPSAALAAATL
jgi:hypothetical protein